MYTSCSYYYNHNIKTRSRSRFVVHLHDGQKQTTIVCSAVCRKNGQTTNVHREKILRQVPSTPYMVSSTERVKYNMNNVVLIFSSVEIYIVYIYVLFLRPSKYKSAIQFQRHKVLYTVCTVQSLLNLNRILNCNLKRNIPSTIY